jgi:hypothetical protein
LSLALILFGPDFILVDKIHTANEKWDFKKEIVPAFGFRHFGCDPIINPKKRVLKIKFYSTFFKVGW